MSFFEREKKNDNNKRILSFLAGQPVGVIISLASLSLKTERFNVCCNCDSCMSIAQQNHCGIA